MHHRRKFRSQTSDNMDRWKAEMGRVREKRGVEERSHMIRPLLTFKHRFVWQAQEIVYLAKVSKTCGFFWQFQKRWLAWDIQTGCAEIHVAWQAQYKRHMSCRRLLDMLGGQGADFLRGAAFWSIWSSGLLRWFCVTGAALHNTFDNWRGKITKRIGTRPSALDPISVFEGCLAELLRFWCCQVRNLGRLAEFLQGLAEKLQRSNFKEV